MQCYSGKLSQQNGQDNEIHEILRREQLKFRIVQTGNVAANKAAVQMDGVLPSTVCSLFYCIQGKGPVNTNSLDGKECI